MQNINDKLHKTSTWLAKTYITSTEKSLLSIKSIMYVYVYTYCELFTCFVKSTVLYKRGVVTKIGKHRKFDMRNNMFWPTFWSIKHVYKQIIYTLQNDTSIFAKILILQNKCISLCPTKHLMIYEKVSRKTDAHSFLLVMCLNIKHGMICKNEAHL